MHVVVFHSESGSQIPLNPARIVTIYRHPELGTAVAVDDGKSGLTYYVRESRDLAIELWDMALTGLGLPGSVVVEHIPPTAPDAPLYGGYTKLAMARQVDQRKNNFTVQSERAAAAPLPDPNPALCGGMSERARARESEALKMNGARVGLRPSLVAPPVDRPASTFTGPPRFGH